MVNKKVNDKEGLIDVMPQHIKLYKQLEKLIKSEFEKLKVFNVEESRKIIDELKNLGFEYIAKDKVFELLDIKTGTLDKWVNNGTLNRSMIGNKIYFHIDDIRTMMVKHLQDKSKK